MAENHIVQKSEKMDNISYIDIITNETPNNIKIR